MFAYSSLLQEGTTLRNHCLGR